MYHTMDFPSEKVKTENNKITALLLRPEDLDNELVTASASFWNACLETRSETNTWTLTQKKLFILILSEINKKKEDINCKITLDNKYIAEKLNWNYSKANFHKATEKIKNDLDYMVGNSKLRLQDPITKKWYSGNLIVEADGNSRTTRIAMNPKFFNHFQDHFFFASICGPGFFGMVDHDLLRLPNDYAYRLFLDIRTQAQVSNTPVEVTLEYPLHELLIKLGIDEWDYMKGGDKKNKIRGTFNFYGFEKKVLDKIIEVINKSEQIVIHECAKGKFYEKLKNGKTIYGYRIHAKVYDNNTIKRNREDLISFAKTQGYTVEYPKKIIDAIPAEPIINPQWSVLALDKDKEKELKAQETRKKDVKDSIKTEIQHMPDCMLDFEDSNTRMSKEISINIDGLRKAAEEEKERDKLIREKSEKREKLAIKEKQRQLEPHLLNK